MARRRTIALLNACCGSMSMSPHCPLAPRPMDGAQSQQDRAESLAMDGECLPGNAARDVVAGEGVGRASPESRPGGPGNPPGLDAGAAAADCAAPRWGLWDH